MKTLVGFRKPDVPGFCPSMGEVATVCTFSGPGPKQTVAARAQNKKILFISVDCYCFRAQRYDMWCSVIIFGGRRAYQVQYVSDTSAVSLASS